MQQHYQKVCSYCGRFNYIFKQYLIKQKDSSYIKVILIILVETEVLVGNNLTRYTLAVSFFL
jgi:hypothetical protein